MLVLGSGNAVLAGRPDAFFGRSGGLFGAGLWRGLCFGAGGQFDAVLAGLVADLLPDVAPVFSFGRLWWL